MRRLLATIAALFLLACSSLPDVEQSQPGDFDSAASEVFVVSHGWHTGLVLPAESIQSHLPALKQRFGNTRYIEFGWGDKGFYQAKKITSGLTLRAIFWPTESVIHAVAVPKNPKEYFRHSQVERICVSGNDYAALLRFVQNSFFRDLDGEVAALNSGIYGDAQFYKGMGDYYLMNTCNKWTAKGLKSAGVDVNPVFKLTADSVMSVVTSSQKAHVNGGCAAAEHVVN